ncbi:MAG: N-acetylmuramoyl-L-alanine amidase, partial [Desulfobacterales bacterium]
MNVIELMDDFSKIYNKRWIWVVSLCLVFILNLPQFSAAYTRTDRLNFQRSIVDYRSRLNPSYKKIRRKQTKYIIVHTSELGVKMTLRVVSKGKRLRNGRRTYG